MDHRLPFEALIFVEATIADNNEERRAMGKLLTGLTWAKRDTWASRKSAEKDFAKNPVYQTWDKQALELYLVRCFMFTGIKAHYDVSYTLLCRNTPFVLTQRRNSNHRSRLRVSLQWCQRISKPYAGSLQNLVIVVLI